MKQIIFDGRIGKDAEVRTTKGGKPFVRFSVANNSFVGGQDKTEWFDVTSYDSYVIENRVKYLKKGTYVIINGALNTEVAVKDGKIWQNQYVTAVGIDTPSFGKKDSATPVEHTEDVGVSTYTAQTQTVKPNTVTEAYSQPTPQQEVAQPTYAQPQPQPSYATVGASYGNSESMDDDLPF